MLQNQAAEVQIPSWSTNNS